MTYKSKYLINMEKIFIAAIKEAIEELLELIKLNYSIVERTYQQLCLTEMNELQLISVMDKKITALRDAIYNKSNHDTLIFFLYDIISFSVVWYVLKYSPSWWSSYGQRR